MAKDKSGDAPDLKLVTVTNDEAAQTVITAPPAPAEAAGPSTADLLALIHQLQAQLAVVQQTGAASNEQAQQATADAPAPEGADEAWHVVQPGEYWESIAQAHNTDVETLHALNAHLPHFSDRSVTIGARVRVQAEPEPEQVAADEAEADPTVE